MSSNQAPETTPAHSLKFASSTPAAYSEGTHETYNTSTSTRSNIVGHAYGIPIRAADPKGEFPQPGSVLGPYFCLGQLGKGTFSSIHKCAYIGGPETHWAAAKVEIADGQFTGVLDSESSMLDYLAKHLPPDTVPKYYGYYKAPKVAALFMECLPYPDLRQLSERNGTRQLALADAIHLCADGLIPLLREMHRAGIVHRDVKPGNCIAVNKDSFRMVDFGLSKSIVVASHHEAADTMHPYPEDRPWLKPHRATTTSTTTTATTLAATSSQSSISSISSSSACFKRERASAEFRGTSMYASLLVHQGKDYAPRDDMWSVLYVFCDLVSGGLPWMTHAQNRERQACERTKQVVSEEQKYDALLKGGAYHVAMYKRELAKKRKVDIAKLPVVPSPLALSTDAHKVELLARAFASLQTLEFWSTPDYELLQECIRGFGVETIPPEVPIATIQWDQIYQPSSDSANYQKSAIPTFTVLDAPCPLSDKDVVEAEKERDRSKMESDPWSRLPVKLRYHLAQMDGKPLAPELGLRDFMAVGLLLLYGEWDSKRFEDGGHRTSTDGFRRLRYLDLLRSCEIFGRQYIHHRECYYHLEDGKRRRLTCSNGMPSLPMISKVMAGLRYTIAAEEKKTLAPPVRISFG
jgi:serine/threonine protein kinase